MSKGAVVGAWVVRSLCFRQDLMVSAGIFSTPAESAGDFSLISGRPVIGRLIPPPQIPRGSQSVVVLPSSII